MGSRVAFECSWTKNFYDFLNGTPKGSYEDWMPGTLQFLMQSPVLLGLDELLIQLVLLQSAIDIKADGYLELLRLVQLECNKILTDYLKLELQI